MDDIRPFLPNASLQQERAILGAMQAVARIDDGVSEADRRALASAAHYLFGHADPATTLADVTPAVLATALKGTSLALDAVKFVTVMAFVDGKLDQKKIAHVLDYAKALGIEARFLDDIAEAAQHHVDEALACMARANLESITGRKWVKGDTTAWFLPYGNKPDPALEKRFQALGTLPPESFGHAFFSHYNRNSYAFPGAPTALNIGFGVPHDSAHVLSHYDTSARGELLVSTFTAAMHPQFPMAGHILPVIFSWHLDIQINPIAKHAAGALDADEFWRAWAGGVQTTVDTFAPDWDFWRYVGEPLIALRERWNIPPGGVEGHPERG
jgi:tellurite resistance protein